MSPKNNQQDYGGSFNKSKEWMERRITFKSKQNSNGKQNSKFTPHNKDENGNMKERKPWKKQKFNSVKSAQIEYEKIQQRKQETREKARKRKEEVEAALNKYKQKKKEKYKKLSAKTSRGQPIMKNRIELLLEEIQSSIKS